MKDLLTALLVVMATVLFLVHGFSSEDRLVSRLLHQLRPTGAIARPVGRNASQPVQVELSLSLMRLECCGPWSAASRVMWPEVLERGSAKFDFWFKMNWTDPRLSWDPRRYGNLNQVALPVDLLWLPDIRPYNAAEYKPDKETATRAVVEHNSQVTYVLPVNLRTTCYRLSNGTLECFMKLGSWVYNGGQLNIQLGKPPIEDISFDVLEGFEIVGTSAIRRTEVYDCCPDPFVSVIYTFLFNPRRGSQVVKRGSERRPGRDD